MFPNFFRMGAFCLLVWHFVTFVNQNCCGNVCISYEINSLLHVLVIGMFIAIIAIKDRKMRRGFIQKGIFGVYPGGLFESPA